MNSIFAPSGLITLTTDFGHKGPFVATMKGVMLKRFPGARFIDLTHDTDVHFPAEAGFWLSRSYSYFPDGTVHVAVVDPGVGTSRSVVVTVLDGHAFLAPDNGLLAPLAERPNAITRLLSDDAMQALKLDEISATFHGRDIFAPLAAALAAGRMKPQDVGPLSRNIVPSWVEPPAISDAMVSGVVIAVDNFGNLITNLDKELLTRFETPIVKAGGREFEMHRTYGEITPGDFMGLINSFGVLEIARAEGNAADALGLSRGAPVSVSNR